MATLSYGGLDLGKYLRTVDFSCEPVFSDDGVDVLCNKVDIEVQGVISPAGPPLTLATNQAAGGGNDRAGQTLAALRTFLEAPRLQLVYAVGNDVALVSPQNVPEAPGVFPCDVRNGPFPGRLRALGVTGDKSVLFAWKVTTYTPVSAQFCMSNRWAARAEVNEFGYTTRYVEGRAEFRADWMQFRHYGADEFRKLLLVPAPAGFRRERVDVTATSDGLGVYYRVTDRQKTWNLGGAQRTVTKVRGSVTTGVSSDIKNLSQLAQKIGEGLSTITGAAFGAITGGPFAAASSITKFAGSVLPTPSALAEITVHGQRDSDRAAMVSVAAAVILDRLRPLTIGSTLFPVSLYATQVVDDDAEPVVMVRMEALCASLTAIKTILNPKADIGGVSSLQNWSNRIDLGTGAFWDQADGTGNPPLPAGDNTRGGWLGSLVVQALTQGYDLPAPPPADVVVQDFSVLG